MELHRDPAARIGRPRQIYTGANKRDYVPMNKR
jgi:citrate synthase